MARKIAVDIVINDRNVAKKFQDAGRSAQGLAGSIGQLRVSIGSLVKSTLIVDGVEKAMEALHATVHEGIHEFSEHAHVSSQTAAALKSTGGVANVTAEQIDKLGLSLSNLSGVNDEVIQGGENVLLAFQNIRNFSGKGNQIFTEATKASLDFAVRSGRSVQAASVAVGRALQDPAKAAGSLRRAYVVLTSSEKAAIASAVRHGDTLKAQRLIISDLEKRYGGAAAAAGKTLPGALNILRERFADLAGQGIGLVGPALTKAAVSLAGFVGKVTEASGARAKFHLVFDGIQSVGSDLFSAVEKQIESIDWGRLAASAERTASRVAHEIAARLSAVNWRARISEAGKAVGDGLVFLLNHLQDAIKRVNWNRVGQEIVRGLEVAIGAVAVFLASVNWNKVTHVLVNTLGTALKAAGSLLVGVGEALGRAVLTGIEAGLKLAGAAVERVAVKIVLAIIEPFTHLPSFLGGGPFQQMKDGLNATLAQMTQDGGVGGQNIGAAVVAGIAAGVGPASSPLRGGAKASAARAANEAAAAGLPAPPDATGGKPRPGISAAQRNTFFDNSISRILLRGGLGTITQQIAALTKADALIARRIKATKDVTRKLNLEDQLLQNQNQISQLTAQRASDALADRQAAVAARQAKAAARAARNQSNQFKALGLSGTGDQIIPLRNLKTELARVSDAVKGTILDTGKTRSLFSNIRKIFAGGFSSITKDTKAQIKTMLDGIDEQLKNHSQSTKFRHVSSSAILSGLGLSPEQIRNLRSRITQVGAGGLVPGSRSAAFAGAGASNVVVHTQINLDGKKVAANTTAHQQRHGQRRSVSRSGPYAGRH